MTLRCEKCMSVRCSVLPGVASGVALDVALGVAVCPCLFHGVAALQNLA